VAGAIFEPLQNSKEIFDSFLIPKRSGGSEFEYMVFAWNGK
jgi:hypothetical protein